MGCDRPALYGRSPALPRLADGAPALRAAHGAAGEARARDFSWDRINQSVADTYARLIAAKG